jgi:hypothetical protein
MVWKSLSVANFRWPPIVDGCMRLSGHCCKAWSRAREVIEVVVGGAGAAGNGGGYNGAYGGSSAANNFGGGVGGNNGQQPPFGYSGGNGGFGGGGGVISVFGGAGAGSSGKRGGPETRNPADEGGASWSLRVAWRLGLSLAQTDRDDEGAFRHRCGTPGRGGIGGGCPGIFTTI